jgi:MoaA/NifB/PqqE/SkfB family radical SAM enzyme
VKKADSHNHFLLIEHDSRDEPTILPGDEHGTRVGRELEEEHQISALHFAPHVGIPPGNFMVLVKGGLDGV